VHIPVIGAVTFILLSAEISLQDSIGVIVAMLVATVVGTLATMAMLYLLLAPVSRAAQALREYLGSRALPSLPTRYDDEAGVLLANVQEAVTRLDTAIDTAHTQRDDAIREHRSKFEVLAGMSHDLRTPLNHVIGFAEMMTTEALGPLGSNRYRDYASDFRESGGDLLSTLQNILDLSAVELEGDAAATTPGDLGAALEQAVRLTHFRTDRTGMSVSINAGPGDGPIILAPDRSLKQILIHTLHAAIGADDAVSRLDMSVGTTGGRSVLTVTSDAAWEAGDVPPDLADSAARGVKPTDSPADAAPDGAADMRSTTQTALRLSLVHSLARSAEAALAITTPPGGGRSISIAFRRAPDAETTRAA